MGKKRKNENIVVSELGDELLIYDLETEKAFCLNRTSAAVWDLFEESRTAADISRLLETRGVHGSSPELVELALDQLCNEGLLLSDEPRSHNGFDRREMVRRAGLTAAAALPLITSLVVPLQTPAQSVSCGASAGSTCTCSNKVRNFNIPCTSTTCSGVCVCSPPFTGCNGGGHFCQGHCL